MQSFVDQEPESCILDELLHNEDSSSPLAAQPSSKHLFEQETAQDFDDDEEDQPMKASNEIVEEEEVQEIDLFEETAGEKQSNPSNRMREVNELAEELRLQAERNRSEQAIKFLGVLAEDLKI
jgi:hypothetical protein